MSQPDLFTPVRLGALELPNRILMAPMTRNRAGAGNVPTPLMAEYYAQRASAGLLISEATQVSPEGQGYPNTPGIHSDAQAEGWARIAQAVHDRGGRIAVQLWHVGRVSHTVFQPGGALPVAPSAIAAAGQGYTPSGLQDYPTPRALETEEIPGIVRAYAEGARRAIAAGIDAVEIHAANGYLIDQFLRSGTNRRSDAYGGSVVNRARFLVEVTEAVVAAVGAGRVGVRLSPTGSFNDMRDSDPLTTFGHAVERLTPYGLAFLHVIEGLPGSMMAPAEGTQPVARELRRIFKGPFVLNGGYSQEAANAVLAEGAADAVSFGVPFIANPDLPARFRRNAPLAEADRATFYGGTERGYTDYPALATAAAE